MTIIERSETRSIALFPWNHEDGFAYQEQCVRALCENQSLILEKRSSGQPFLLNSTLGVSLSHTANTLAVSVSKNHSPGIDIEQLRQKIIRIASRVFSEAELAMVSSYPTLEALHILWGAKEAVYKSYGKRGLIFKSDMEVLPFPYPAQKGEIFLKFRDSTYYSLQYQFLPNQTLLVYTTGAREKF